MLWLNRALLATALGIAGVVLQRGWEALATLPVGRIAVAGHLDGAQQRVLQETVKASLDGGFLSADLATVRDSLQSLPWVYRASVRRRWPDTLAIHVVEQRPIARWGSEGFMNHEGEVFAASGLDDSDGLDLPLIYGPAGSEGRLMRHYQRLRDMLAPLGLSVTRLEQDAIGQLEAELGAGLRLRLGNEDFLLRARRFIALYREDLAQRPERVASVDLRYARGAAVSFHEPQAVAAVDNAQREGNGRQDG
jgi:cell division protein FtsQ